MMRRGFYYSLIDGKIYDEFEDKYLTNEETVETLNELRTQKSDLIGEVAQLNYYFNKLNEKGIKWADIIDE